jgi:hypothetical protein
MSTAVRGVVKFAGAEIAWSWHANRLWLGICGVEPERLETLCYRLELLISRRLAPQPADPGIEITRHFVYTDAEPELRAHAIMMMSRLGRLAEQVEGMKV